MSCGVSPITQTRSGSNVTAACFVRAAQRVRADLVAELGVVPETAEREKIPEAW